MITSKQKVRIDVTLLSVLMDTKYSPNLLQSTLGLDITSPSNFTSGMCFECVPYLLQEVGTCPVSVSEFGSLGLQIFSAYKIIRIFIII